MKEKIKKMLFEFFVYLVIAIIFYELFDAPAWAAITIGLIWVEWYLDYKPQLYKQPERYKWASERDEDLFIMVTKKVKNVSVIQGDKIYKIIITNNEI